jgi:hypothetical protein
VHQLRQLHKRAADRAREAKEAAAAPELQAFLERLNSREEEHADGDMCEGEVEDLVQVRCAGPPDLRACDARARVAPGPCGPGASWLLHGASRPSQAAAGAPNPPSAAARLPACRRT